MASYQELDSYKLSYQLAIRVSLMTRKFPKEEVYGMSSQINRSSRSVCANIVEAYRKRRYPKHFISKLSDADGECSETLLWLKMSVDLGYISDEDCNDLTDGFERVGRMIGKMMQHPEKFNNRI